MTGNERFLTIYQLLNAIAIAIGANWVVTDMILLHMKFDLALFGVVKSSMFLVPALAYWAAAGVLRKWNRDRLVCLWSYLGRILLPLALPIVAMATADREIRFGVSLAVFAGGYTLALFAKNSLLSLYRGALPPAEFNRNGLLLSALPGPVAMLTALPAVWLLGRIREEQFFPLLLIIHLLTLLPEIPAAAALLRVRVPERPRPDSLRFQEWLMPFGDGKFRPLLVFSFLHAFWMGVPATYLVVFLLKIRDFPPFGIALIEFALSVAAVVGARLAGRLADRFGYAAVMAAGAAAITAVSILWVIYPAAALPLFLFLFCIENGNNGFVAVTLRNLEGCAAAALAAPGRINGYVAAFTLVQAVGCFIGCLFAGPLFALLPGNQMEQFHLLFAIAVLPAAAMMFFSFYWLNKRKAAYAVN